MAQTRILFDQHTVAESKDHTKLQSPISQTAAYNGIYHPSSYRLSISGHHHRTESVRFIHLLILILLAGLHNVYVCTGCSGCGNCAHALTTFFLFIIITLNAELITITGRRRVFFVVHWKKNSINRAMAPMTTIWYT